MRKRLLTFAAIGVLSTATMTACSSSDDSTATVSTSNTTVGKGDGKDRVGVILPDLESAQRWGNDDPKDLQAEFKAANVPVEIENAKGDKAAFVKIAQNMVDNGVKVLIIANLDSVSGKQALDAAKAKNVPTIDYDRLTLNGGANYFVTYDGKKVGEQQALALADCLRARNVSRPVIAELNGSPTDNNATLFKNGYDGVLNQNYDEGTMLKGPDQPVPDWNPAQGEVIFAQMLKQRPDINGVLVANDGLAASVIKVLAQHGKNGKVPVTGQDASTAGLQAVLAGDQCVTIYKPVKQEAHDAAAIASALFKKQDPGTVQGITFSKIKDPESGAYITSDQLKPIPITVDNVSQVINDGAATVKAICTAKYEAYCRQHGLLQG